MTSEIPADASPADLHRLAVERPDLRPAVARHPALYPDLRAWLAALGDPAVDAALAPTGSPAPAEPGSPRPRRRLGRLFAIVAAALVLAVGIVVGAFTIYNLPRYPETTPIDRGQVEALLESIPWIDDVQARSRADRAGSVAVIEGTEPRECGAFRAFGIAPAFGPDDVGSSEDFWTMTVPESGPWDWIGVRLFTSADLAETFVAGRQDAMGRCGGYVDGNGQNWTLDDRSSSYPAADLAAYATFEQTYVVIRRDNAVFYVIFDEAPVSGATATETVELLLQTPLP